MKDEYNQLDMHSHFDEHGRNDLVLHPLMEVFLQIKWRQVQWFFGFEFFIRFMFVMSLSYMAFRYMALTTCEYDKDDGTAVPGFVPKDNYTFRPKVNNFLYIGGLNGTRLNITHSSFTSSDRMYQEMPITCNNDNLM